jgi:DNA replication protein DnaC
VSVWRCPLNACEGTGIVLDHATNTASPCGCRDRMLAARRTASISSVIPARFVGAAWDRAPVVDLPQRVTAPIRQFARDVNSRLDDGSGLWLAGPVGTAKTTLGMLVCKAAIEAGRTVAIYSLPRLLNVIRDTFDSDHSQLELLDRLAVVDLLHLDDIGAEKTSAWVLETLYSIVDARYEGKHSTVITTNVTDREQLNEQLGERTVSRLHEMCEQIEVTGPDMRVIAS